MIVVKLMGGLGNQMFQYAMARALSLRANTELKLDLSWFESEIDGETNRPYELSNFFVTKSIATSIELKQLKGYDNRFVRRLRPIVSRLMPMSWQTHIQEKYFHFDPAILSIKKNAYLSGYWQSEQYFFDFMNAIRNDFIFKQSLSGENKRIAEEILAYNSVSLHIRRGDYVNKIQNINMFESCSFDYYYKGLTEISARQSDLRIYVFSDDIEWAKDNLNMTYPTLFIDHNQGKDAFEDMRLMSLCKYNIIANSSFSWWGAWLNQYPEKIVIAPKRWFSQASYDTSDLLPEGWIRL